VERETGMAREDGRIRSKEMVGRAMEKTGAGKIRMILGMVTGARAVTDGITGTMEIGTEAMPTTL